MVFSTNFIFIIPGCNLGKNSLWINYFPHPCDDSQVVYVVYDQPHLLKSLAGMFRSGQCFKLPQEFLQKHNLEFEFVELDHVKQLLKFQDQTLLKLSPYLKENCLDPSHFEVSKYLKKPFKTGNIPEKYISLHIPCNLI